MGTTTSLAMTAALAASFVASPLFARDAVRQVPGVTPTAAPAATTGPSAPAQGGPQIVTPPAAETAAPPSSAAGAAERGALTVSVNRAKVIRLPEKTQTVIVGNPAIADLSVQKNGIVVVTGKSYGTTNLIALDGSGNMLAESLVTVVAPTDGLLIVQRAFDRSSYSCSPTCQPSVNLGDSNAYFNDSKTQAETNNRFSTSR